MLTVNHNVHWHHKPHNRQIFLFFEGSLLFRLEWPGAIVTIVILSEGKSVWQNVWLFAPGIFFLSLHIPAFNKLLKLIRIWLLYVFCNTEQSWELRVSEHLNTCFPVMSLHIPSIQARQSPALPFLYDDGGGNGNGPCSYTHWFPERLQTERKRWCCRPAAGRLPGIWLIFQTSEMHLPGDF